MFDVEIDVGRTVAFGGEKAFEQQTERDRIGLRDPQRVTDRAVRGTAPPLAVDVVRTTEIHDVVHEEEIAGETHLVDHPELVVDLTHRLLVLRMGRRVVHRRASPGELAQPTHVGMAFRHRIVGQVRDRDLQIERARRRDVDRAFDRTRIPGESSQLLVGAAQMCKRCRRQPSVEFVETATGPDRRERRRELPTVRGCVMHVVGGNHFGAGAHRELSHCVVARPVEWVAVIPEFDEDPVPAERGHQLFQDVLRSTGSVSHQRRRHHPFPTPRGREPRTARLPRGRQELFDAQLRRALRAAQLCRADRAGQRRVPGRTLRQDQHVFAGRLGTPARRPLDTQGEFRAEHRRQAEWARGFGEPHHAVQPVVIGHGQPRQPQPMRFLGQLLRMARAIEKREVRVAMQLCVSRSR